MAKTKNDLSAWASDIDLDATRALVEQLNTERIPWDKIEAGEGKYVSNYRRICPKRPDWTNPYNVMAVHYLGPNNRMVVCRKEAGLGECPACQLRRQLDDGGDEQAARGLRPSIRTFLNVVRVDKEGSLTDDGIYCLGLNQLQFIGKRGVEYDPDEESELPLFYFFEKYGDLSHVETGRTLRIKAKKDKSGDYNVINMKFTVDDPSPFPGTSEMLTEKLVDLGDVATAVEPQEMMSIIEGRDTGLALLGAGPVVDAEVKELPAAEEKSEPAEKKSRFDDDDDDEEAKEEPAAEEKEDEEEEDEDPKAGKTPPKTDPAAALARLRASQEK